jgi:hypothetical protein
MCALTTGMQIPFLRTAASMYFYGGRPAVARNGCSPRDELASNRATALTGGYQMYMPPSKRKVLRTGPQLGSSACASPQSKLRIKGLRRETATHSRHEYEAETRPPTFISTVNFLRRAVPRRQSCVSSQFEHTSMTTPDPEPGERYLQRTSATG